MNLADMLSFTDIRELNRIAQTYGCECNLHSKHELIQNILSSLNRRESFRGQVAALGLEEIRFLNSLLFDPGEAFTLEELTARVKQSRYGAKNTDGIQPREVIAKFMQRGWLFNGHLQKTRFLFHIPSDLKNRFVDVLAQHFREDLRVFPEAPSAYRDERQLLADDLYRFVQYLSQNEVPLNAEGYMYKRSVQQIQERFAIAEEPVGKEAWRFGYGRRFKEYPIRFSFLYDYAFRRGWFREEENRIELTKEGEECAASGHREETGELYRVWLRLYRHPIPNLASLVYWTEKLARGWTSVETLGAVLCRLIKPYYYDSPESIFEQKVMRMMTHLGMLQAGEDERCGRVVKISAMGSELISAYAAAASGTGKPAR